MALTLSITKSPSGVSPRELQKRFAEQGGSIGRGEINEMVLEDPDRFLSTCHCKISGDGGRFFLTDTSTNGTFLNSAPEPIGKGTTVVLAHADTIEVGDYQFSVDIEGPLIGDPQAKSVKPSPFGDVTDPFGSVDDFADFSDNKADPFGSSLPASPQSSDVSGTFSSSDPFANDPFGLSGSHPVVTDPYQENFDPLAALDNAGSSHQPFHANEARSDSLSLGDLGLGAAGGSNASPSSIEDDFLGLSPQASGAPIPDVFGVSGNSVSAPTHSDGASQLNQAVSWPEPKESGVIPDDWDDWDDLLGDSLEEAPLNSPSEFDRSSHSQHIPPQSGFDHQDHRSIASSDFPGAQAKPRAPELEPQQANPFNGPAGNGPADNSLEALLQARLPDPAPAEPFAQVADSSSGRPQIEKALNERAFTEGAEAVFEKPHQSKPFAKPGMNHAEKNSTAERSRAAGSGSFLLESMGIDVSSLNASEISEIEQSIGELMPVIVGGMMQVLRSRTSIKNEFRMNVTTIQPVENNPLKFSANPSDAIENMFLRKSGAYKAPVDAFQEGFDGIGEHQVAIIAGIRAAFESMMERFNPVGLEKQFDKYNKGMTLPGMQKAKYWNGYIDHYKGLVDNMENSFQYLFGDEFVQAYEDQLRILSTDRKNR